VLALIVRLIDTGGSRIDRVRALLCRHHCQSSVVILLLLVRDSWSDPGRAFSRIRTGCVESLVTILRGRQICTA
jgi:hypothetical protein